MTADDAGMAPVRVLVVDDHAIVREGLRGVLEAAGLTVVAEASSGLQAVAAAATHHPDVVVMDLQMPAMGGVEATRRILATDPDTAVLVVTMYDDDQVVLDALAAGARGYLLKGADRHEIVAAVRGVAAGTAVFGPGIATRLLDRLTRPTDAATVLPELTARERAVLGLMVEDRTVPAIARELEISEKTVRNNLSNILTKLAVRDRAAAVAAAREAGLVRPPPRP